MVQCKCNLIIYKQSFEVMFILFSHYSYGLLGASGCGKTTLLSCIVGQKKLHEGTINVLGADITTNSGVIGPRIGYMPQVYNMLLNFCQVRG